MDVQVFLPGVNRTTATVVSHERSGTHFLISSLSKGFGYMPVEQRIDLDMYNLPINFYAPEEIANFYAQLQAHNVSSVMKSHHAIDFFEPVIEDILKSSAIFYIYRHPRDVMHSFWRLLKALKWREGPQCATPAEMMREQPQGLSMRYQMYQADSMLHRWMDHVNGWLDVAEQHGDKHKGIHFVRYEDLRDDYAGTLLNLGKNVIGDAPVNTEPPDNTSGVIVPQAMDSTKIEWQAEDLAHIDEVCAGTLKRLGYT